MFEALSLTESLILFIAGYSLAFPLGYLILSQAPSTRALALGLIPLFSAVLALPLLIPPPYKLVRFFLFIPLFNFIIQNLDLAVRRKKFPRVGISLREYLRHSTSGFGSQNPAEVPAPTRKPELRKGLGHLCSALFELSFALGLILANTYFRTPEWGYWINVFSKACYFYLVAAGLADIYFGCCLFVGKEVVPLYRKPLLARSPADFWFNRFNLYIGQSLFRFVFLPVGSRKGAELGILATFTVSGLLHEYQFDTSSLKINGYMLLFFTLHGSAVVLEQKIKRYLRRQHRSFYKRVSQSRALPFVLVPLQLLFMLFTGAIGLKSFDLIIDLHNIELVKNLLISLPLPPFPGK